jgi:hypothetical protein
MSLLPNRRMGVIERLAPSRRIAIDKALILNTRTLEDIGREIGCSGRTVWEYKTRVLLPLIKKAQDTHESAQRRSARERLSILYAEADKLLQIAKTTKNVRDGVSAVKAMHEMIRTDLECDGELNKSTQPAPSSVLNAEVINVLMLPKSPSLSTQPSISAPAPAPLHLPPPTDD